MALRIPATVVVDTILSFEPPAMPSVSGSETGTAFANRCPTGMAITGFYGSAGSAIDRLGVHCGQIQKVGTSINAGTAAAGTGVNLQWWVTGTETGTLFDDLCPANEFVDSVSLFFTTVNGVEYIEGMDFACSHYVTSGPAGEVVMSASGAAYNSPAIGAPTGLTPVVSCETNQIMSELAESYGPWPSNTAITVTMFEQPTCRPILAE